MDTKPADWHRQFRAGPEVLGVKREVVWLVVILSVVAVISGLGLRRSAPPAPTPTPAPATSALPPVETPNATPAVLPPVDTPDPGSVISPGQQTLHPIEGVKTPELKTQIPVRLTTDLGTVDLEVYPDAAPLAARRFVSLVKAGYYDNTPIFRVIPGFVCQFGLNSRYPQEKERHVPDEPSYFRMEPGTLAFAKSNQPNSATTQLFVNYGDNSMLVSQPGKAGPGIFTVFGRVVRGLDLLKKAAVVGDPQVGLDQSALAADTAGYLKTLVQKPSMILKAELAH